MTMTKQTSNAELARQLVSQCPDAPALTLAKRLYREHPERFLHLEAARTCVRTALGTNGARHRDERAACNGDCYREPRKAGQVFDKLPEPLPQFDTPWGVAHVTGARKTLVLQDIHIPFHDTAALNLAIATGLKRGCDTVILNGDIGDFYSQSSFDRTPNLTRMVDEINYIIQFLGFLRGKFPKARIIWKDGNHEERHWRYLKVKCAEFWGIPQFTLSSILQFDAYGIEYVGEMRPIKLGKLYVLHGHEYRFPLSNPVNPARGLFLRAKSLACCAHFHVSSQHSERDLSGKIISTWSIGALCDMTPAYRPLNGWNSGFAIVKTTADGEFHMDNLRIIDGQVY